MTKIRASIWEVFSMVKVMSREAQILESPKISIYDLQGFSRTPYKVPPIGDFDSAVVKRKICLTESKQ